MRPLVSFLTCWQVNLLAWLAVMAFARPPLAISILVGGALVLVPLGRQLVRITTCEPPLVVTKLCDYLQLPAGWLLVTSCLLPQGGWAAAFAMPWFVMTLLCASEGAWRIVRSRWSMDAVLAKRTAMLFLAIGGGWAVVSRAGLRPMQFSDSIVLLTAVHFHYAGFLLPILTARVASTWPRWPGALLVLAVLAGVPLVGVGITFSPLVEVGAAIMLTAACIGVALGQLQMAAFTRSPHELVLLLISSISLLTAMALAAVYAMGEFTGAAYLTIETMIATHGVANSLGFAGCGIFAWRAAIKNVPKRDAGDSTSTQERRSTPLKQNQRSHAQTPVSKP